MKSNSTPAERPTPVPTAILVWAGCVGPDDGSTSAGVGVIVDAVITADSERIDDVGDVTKLGEVAVCKEEVASVDKFGSVVLRTTCAFAKIPKSPGKSVFWQHPASVTS